METEVFSSMYIWANQLAGLSLHVNSGIDTRSIYIRVHANARLGENFCFSCESNSKLHNSPVSLKCR